MQPPILPVSMPPLSSSSSSSTTTTAITTSSSSLPDLTAISISSPGTSTSMLLKGSEAQVTRLLISSSFHDGIGSSEIKPFLPLPSGFADDGAPAILAATSAGSHRKKRRRRVASDTSISSGSGGSDFDDHPHRDVRRAVVDICSKMFHYLGLGYKWFIRCIGLGCYSVLIMPGFLRVAYFYFFSSQVHRGIIYGDQPRNRLDLYLPKNANGPCPVVAFITGGAWIIGNKAWGSLLGMQLSESNIVVACIDYRNYPQGTISDMVKDASEGISFICNNIAEYGGDPHRIYLMGQSAGAHIGACTLLEQAIKEAGEGESTSWSVSQVKAYFGLSGSYNLFDLLDHFHRRETYSPIFLSIMGGEQSLRRFSPELMVQDPSIRTAVSLLPEMILFHGTGDYTIPSVASKNFADTLQRVGVKAEAILYEGKTHTDLFVQDPMRGGRDEMFKDLVTAIHGDDSETLSNLMVAPPFKRLAPEFMLKLARWVSPF